MSLSHLVYLLETVTVNFSQPYWLVLYSPLHKLNRPGFIEDVIKPKGANLVPPKKTPFACDFGPFFVRGSILDA